MRGVILAKAKSIARAEGNENLKITKRSEVMKKLNVFAQALMVLVLSSVSLVDVMANGNSGGPPLSLLKVIHVALDLKSEDDGIRAGEQILSTVRVKYKGVAISGSAPRTITLRARQSGTAEDRYAYSLADDCYTYSNCSGGQSVAIAYGSEFYIGTAGYDHGRIVELGAESEVPFDSVRLEGEYLVAPASRVPLADIYTTFARGNPQIEIDRVQLKPNHVYLVRTISWPDEDMVTKIRVDALDVGKEVTLTYQKLAKVELVELERQAAEMNEYTRTVEMPQSEGEVTLYNRSHFHNYFFASFNFQYSTSGNYMITRNAWDILFSNDGSGSVSFDVPHSGSGLGAVLDVGEKSLSAVDRSDFPDPNTYVRSRGVRAVKGHTYIVWNLDFGDVETASVRGAFKVLEMAPDGRWVRIQFRRLELTPAPEFQNWEQEPVPTEVFAVGMNLRNQSYQFYTSSVSGSNRPHYNEPSIYLNDGGNGRTLLGYDDRPYGPRTGFVKLASQDFATVTFEQIEAHAGRFQRFVPTQRGDVFAVRAMNYHFKVVFVLRIESVESDGRLRMSVRHLYRARAPYTRQ